MNPITSRPSTRAISATIAASAAALLGGLIMTGCGSSNAAAPTSTAAATPAAATTTTTGTTASGAASLQAYQDCLKSHGVTLPQGGFRGGPGATGGNAGRGADGGTPPQGRPAVSAAQQKALTACASLRPIGGGGGGGFAGAPGGNTDNPAFAKFQNCLKQHGVDPTDANARNSSAFQTALNACRKLLPQGAGGPGAGGTPPAGGEGQGSSAFTQFQTCLRNHGVDPNATGGQSAKTQAALNTCQKLLSGGGTGTSSSSTTTTG